MRDGTGSRCALLEHLHMLRRKSQLNERGSRRRREKGWFLGHFSVNHGDGSESCT